MKKTMAFIIFICIASMLMAQAPQNLSYQSVVRDADGNLVSGTEVGIQISILHGSEDGMPVYVETQVPETNENGLVTLEIGAGNSSDNFSEIKWGDGQYYLKVEIDVDGGTNYMITSVSRILSVPYALHAETFTGYDQLLERIKALEEALENIDPGPPDDSVTDIDGNVYQTVVIGNQRWMAENLRVSRYNNGDDIPGGISDNDWGEIREGAYAIYDHNESNTDGINSPEQMIEAYGKLYNWFAVDDERGLCPQGWRIPGSEDMQELLGYLEGQGLPNESGAEAAGNALKSCRQVDSPLGWQCDTSLHPRWDQNQNHGFDAFGFSGLPGGVRVHDGSYEHIGSWGVWWTTTEEDHEFRARGSVLVDFDGRMLVMSSPKSAGYNVRCIKE